jgi:hypothetical protein
MNPSIIFNSISDWEAYIDNFIITNGVEEITGLIGNNAYNGAVTFIKKSPLNWSKAAIYSSGGVVSLADNFLGVALFMSVTPTSLTFGDNFYNQYLLINMTDSDIPLAGNLVYYNLSGQPIDIIPAKTSVNIVKATNDLWVISNTSSENTSQKQPKTYLVGTTVGAPTVGASTWTNPDFKNSWVVLFLSRSIFIDLINVGDGSAYLSKNLSSDTLTINNYTWQAGDILSYILITPAGGSAEPLAPDIIYWNLTADNTLIVAPNLTSDGQQIIIGIIPNGFTYRWDTPFVFTDNYPEQPGAIGIDTIQLYTFNLVQSISKLICNGQSLNGAY